MFIIIRNWIINQQLTEIEGFYDCKSRVLFLHLISSLDADTMYTSLQSFKEQIRLDNVRKMNK